jgi:hypothetical protein
MQCFVVCRDCGSFVLAIPLQWQVPEQIDRPKRPLREPASMRRRATDARARRLRVHYGRAGRSFYSATEAGRAKMTPDQIAEAQRMAREWKPTK